MPNGSFVAISASKPTFRFRPISVMSFAGPRLSILHRSLSSQLSFLFRPAVWKRFGQDRNRQSGGSRTLCNSIQKVRRKEREYRQPPNVALTEAFLNGDCLERTLLISLPQPKRMLV